MSEFINKSKNIALAQENAELISEVTELKARLSDLDKGQAGQTGEINSDEIEQLKVRIADYEQQEIVFNARILAVAKEVQKDSSGKEILRKLLSALSVEDSASVEAAIERHYRKKETIKKVIAFLFGVQLVLTIWLYVDYSRDGEFFRALVELWQRLIGT